MEDLKTVQIKWKHAALTWNDGGFDLPQSLLNVP